MCLQFNIQPDALTFSSFWYAWFDFLAAQHLPIKHLHGTLSRWASEASGQKWRSSETIDFSFKHNFFFYDSIVRIKRFRT